MKYVVNVRGINASGKSTAVRQFCIKNNMYAETIEYNGNEWKVMTNGKYIAIGHYKPYSNSEGCDSLRKSKEEFKDFLRWLLLRNYEIVVYEKQIWSTTYKLTAEICTISRKCGYTFIAVQMSVDYQSALNSLFRRNGNNFGNLENFDRRFYGVQRSRRKLLQKKVALYDAIIKTIPKEQMYETIYDAIRLHNEGKNNGSIEKCQ